MSEVKKAACIGAGVIGSAWAARLAWNGIDVKVLDPHPEAESRLNEVLANAERALAKLTMAPVAKKGSVKVVRDVKEAVHDADFIQESAPEREDLKIKLLADVDRHCRPDVIIGSSTSGLLPSNLQSKMAHPERFMVGHPFNPVYLMPLVEVVGGKQTTKTNIDKAMAFYRAVGMHPLHVRKEIDAFVADRLMEALWREALWLVEEDVATAEEIDDAMRFGPGLRWSFMGTFLIYRIAGGVEGMRHFMAQFGPALKWPWTKLMDVPELTQELIDKIAAQSDAQVKGVSIRDLERKRDDCLIAVMQALRSQDFAAGKTLKDFEKSLYTRAFSGQATAKYDFTKPIRFYEDRVPEDWTDYNGHMNESRYLQVFCNSSDAVLAHISAGMDYVKSGFSYYTGETHIIHVREARVQQTFYTTTQLIGYDEKRFHLFFEMRDGKTDDLLATGEHVYLHVDVKAGKVCPAPKALLDKLEAIWMYHQKLPKPKQAGRYVGQRTK